MDEASSGNKRGKRIIPTRKRSALEMKRIERDRGMIKSASV